MLKYRLTDINGRLTDLKNPIQVSFSSSVGAPADSLRAVFAVAGAIPEIVSIEVLSGTERVFFGYIDTQCDETSVSGKILTVEARSLAAVLLDNEACPATYCMATMSFLMDRHFREYGFEEYIGQDKAVNGELIIAKGMSEWGVLQQYCKAVRAGIPRIGSDGVIDISGSPPDEEVMVSRAQCISEKHRLSRKELISQLRVRTYSDGGYDMMYESGLASRTKTVRRRYVNAFDSMISPAEEAGELLRKADGCYESVVLVCDGCILCTPGAKLRIENDRHTYKVTEIGYLLNADGEKTTLQLAMWEGKQE